jgi:uncharacterized membrane protein
MATTKQSLHQASSSEPTSTSPMNRQNGRPGSQGRRDQFQPATANGNSRTSAEQLARGLGWFSIGLGLAELLAPRAMAKISGVRSENAGLIQLFGIREIASGVAIFMQGDQPATALWSRVAGDALDLASLGIALASPDSNKARVGFATANVLAVTALDVLCAQEYSRKSTDSPTTQTRKSLIIDRPADELYQAWRNFEQLPRFMRNLESVTVAADGRSHWVAKTPAGLTVKWDAEIVEDTPGELISWRSVEDSEINNSGSVRFRPAPGNRGTIVTVELNYDLPGGMITNALAKLLREDPGVLAQESLRLFKQIMEVGEVSLSDGTLWDNGFLTQRPAQPSEAETQQDDSHIIPAQSAVAAAGTRS